jgi:A/G-specific adenine glycosylase
MPLAANSKHEARSLKPARLVAALLEWFAENARDLPWRRTCDPYAIWVSEIMLQQTQVKTVLPYWERWMRELPTLQALARTRSEKLHKLWEGLGYYTRVRNLRKAARVILREHDGRFPEEFEAVRALPGIGRYTAGAICSIAFNQPVAVLDGNVIRVLTRVFGITDNPRERRANARLWRLAGQLVTHASRDASRPVPEPAPCSRLNQALMELGALICVPRNPRCHACPAAASCTARRRGQADRLPNLGRSPAAISRRFAAFVVESRGRYLVRRRPAGVVNAQLWEFPNVELNGVRVRLRIAARHAVGFVPRELTPMITIKHSITRYRITLQTWQAKPGPGAARTSGRWLPLTRLRRLPFAAAHRRILNQLARAGAADKDSVPTGRVAAKNCA